MLIPGIPLPEKSQKELGPRPLSGEGTLSGARFADGLGISEPSGTVKL